jgi:hypothetical protein
MSLSIVAKSLIIREASGLSFLPFDAVRQMKRGTRD